MGAIALCLTGNSQGSHYFLNLHSGRRIVFNHWTALPMLAEVIHTVHHLLAICKKYKGIVFTDKHGNMIKDYTSSYNNMDTHEYREITGVDSNYSDEGNTNSNHPHRHDTINDDETTGVEIQNHNDDKITGVATQEDDEVTGVAIHNHDEEGRYIMVTDIPGAFLHTDMKGKYTWY